jgi:hypothetical protein
VLFSFEYVSNIESIHEQEPTKDSDFVGGAEVLDPYKGFWGICVREMVKF